MTLATHELYQKLVADFAEKDTALFQPKELVYNVKKEGPITPKQHALLLKLAKQYHFETCCDGQTEDILLEPIETITTERINLNRMTKNEASRLIDHILSTFGR